MVSGFRWQPWLLLIPLTIALGLCLRVMQSIQGLPLDDAYIYWRYIENIRNGQGLSFNPGEVSFGVTSFLYTVVCFLVGWVLPGMDTIHVMQWVGILFFMVLVYFSQRLIWEYTINPWIALLFGILLAGCRPLVMTASAGLETSLFCALVVVLIYRMLQRPRTHPTWLGIGASLLFLTRPEGLLLPVGYTLLLLHGVYLLRLDKPTFPSRSLPQYLALFWAGFALFSLPYMFFVKYHSGFWLPTTFYGKLYNLNAFTLFPWSEKVRSGFLFILNSVKEMIGQDSTPFLFCIFFVLFCLLVFSIFYRSGRRDGSVHEYAALGSMAFLFLYPFLLGSKFNVYPPFGGYFIRYIQFLLVLLHIEAALALHLLLRHFLSPIPSPTVRRRLLTAASIAIGLVIVLRWYPTVQYHLPRDIELYSLHTSLNEGVRKQAAYWLRDNTPPQTRVLVGTTGLGVVGGYCERYCKDEAGLINPEIHPYLKDALAAYPDLEKMHIRHWINLMEYMKRNRLTFYTAYTPIPLNTRFTQVAAEIIDPAMEGSPRAKDLSKILIYRFTPQETYYLTEEYREHATFRDLAHKPKPEGRVRITTLQDLPAIAVDVREVTSEIEAEYIYPDEAVFTAGLALDYPPREFADDEWVRFSVFAEAEGVRTRVFMEEIPLRAFRPRQILKKISVPLETYSSRLGKLTLAVAVSPKKEPGLLWATWTAPLLTGRTVVGQPGYKNGYN